MLMMIIITTTMMLMMLMIIIIILRMMMTMLFGNDDNTQHLWKPLKTLFYRPIQLRKLPVYNPEDERIGDLFGWKFCGFDCWIYIPSIHLCVNHQMRYYSIIQTVTSEKGKLGDLFFAFMWRRPADMKLKLDNTTRFMYLEPQTTIYKWLFQLDDSKYLYRKWLFHQTSIYKWLFGVPGIYTHLPLDAPIETLHVSFFLPRVLWPCNLLNMSSTIWLCIINWVHPPHPGFQSPPGSLHVYTFLVWNFKLNC